MSAQLSWQDFSEDIFILVNNSLYFQLDIILCFLSYTKNKNPDNTLFLRIEKRF